MQEIAKQKYNNKYIKLELLLNYISIFYISSSIYPFLVYLGIGSLESKIKLIVSFIMFNSILLILLIDKRKKKLLNLKGLHLILCITLIITLSMYTSINRITTMESIIYLLLTTIYAIYLYMRYPLNTILEIIFKVFSFITIASLIIIVILPNFGLNPDGYWKGIYSTKNELGRAMVISIMLSYRSLKLNDSYSKPKKLCRLFIITISLINLYFSGNTSSMMIIISIILLNRYIKFNSKLKLFAMLLLITALFIIFVTNTQKLASIFELIGKDYTLTGRTEIWQISLNRIKNSPFLGYGYRASWDVEYMSKFSYYRGFMVNAHNGFLELTLEIGILGSIIYFSQLVYSIIKNSFYFYHNKSEGMIISFILLYIFFSNFLESFTIQPMSIFWIIQVIAFIGARNNYHKKINEGCE